MESSSPPGGADEQDLLERWDAIAAYLKVTPRTAQRWASEEVSPLPVYREKSTNGGSRVFARQKEVEEWRKNRQIKISATVRWRWPGRRVLVASLVALLMLIGVAVGLWARSRSAAVHFEPAALPGRLLWRVTSEAGVAPSVELPAETKVGVVSASGDRYYVTANNQKWLMVLDATTLGVQTIDLPEFPWPVVLSPDGDLAYVGSLSGALMIVDVAGRRVRETIEAGAPISDMAVTPDGLTLFAAMRQRGVKRLDLRSRRWSTITAAPCPWYVNLDPPGKRLVVSFQCGGPNGRNGHDAVEIFDVETGRRLDSFAGPPIVGGKHAFSPDGENLWIDGGDACSAPGYDHEGCLVAPGRSGYVYHIADRKMVHTFGFPADRFAWPQFLAGRRVLFSAASASVHDIFNFLTIEEAKSPPFEEFGHADISADGRRAFFASYPNKVAVVDVEPDACRTLEANALSFLGADGTGNDSLEGANLSPGNKLRFSRGFIGQALLLDAEGPSVQIDGPANWRFGDGDSSIAFYVKLPPQQSPAPLLEYVVPNHKVSWRLATAAEGTLTFTFAEKEIAPLSLSGSRMILDGQWRHIVLTKNQDTLRLFVDGRLDAEARTSNGEILTGTNFPNPVKLGWSDAMPGRLRGLIDEIAMWSRLLTPEEVKYLYERRSRAPCKP